jgi:hypothetical protein
MVARVLSAAGPVLMPIVPAGEDRVSCAGIRGTRPKAQITVGDGLAERYNQSHTLMRRIFIKGRMHIYKNHFNHKQNQKISNIQ